MKKMVKTLLTIVSMIAITLSVFLVSASAAGNTIGSATNLSIGGSCSGTLSSTNEYDYYKCNLSSSGKIHFKFVAYAKSTVYIYLFDSKGNEVDYFGIHPNDDLGYCFEEKDCYFTKGIFYIKIDSFDEDIRYGTYNISTSFTSANESFTETLNDNDNIIGNANPIEINKSYSGQLGYSDEDDFYVLNVKSGCTANISAKAFSESTMYISILDSSYKSIDWIGIYPNKNLNYCVLNKDMTFSEGKYYFKFTSDGSDIRVGFYNFLIKEIENKPKTEEKTESYNKKTTEQVRFESTSKIDTSDKTNDNKQKISNEKQIEINNIEDTTLAVEERYTYNNFTYEIIDSEIVIIDYFGNGNSVVIPSDINGMSVIEISDGAFDGTDVEEITVPHTIIKFGENAFGQNDNTDVVIICDKNSAAEVYANKNGIDCQIKDEISDKSDEMNSEINNRIPKEYIVPGIVLLIIIAAVTVALLVKKNKNDIEKN